MPRPAPAPVVMVLPMRVMSPVGSVMIPVPAMMTPVPMAMSAAVGPYWRGERNCRERERAPE